MCATQHVLTCTCDHCTSSSSSSSSSSLTTGEVDGDIPSRAWLNDSFPNHRARWPGQRLGRVLKATSGMPLWAPCVRGNAIVHPCSAPCLRSQPNNHLPHAARAPSTVSCAPTTALCSPEHRAARHCSVLHKTAPAATRQQRLHHASWQSESRGCVVASQASRLHMRSKFYCPRPVRGGAWSGCHAECCPVPTSD